MSVSDTTVSDVRTLRYIEAPPFLAICDQARVPAMGHWSQSPALSGGARPHRDPQRRQRGTRPQPPLVLETSPDAVDGFEAEENVRDVSSPVALRRFSCASGAPRPPATLTDPLSADRARVGSATTPDPSFTGTPEPKKRLIR